MLQRYIPVGSVAIAIIIGIIYGNTAKPSGHTAAGISFSEKTLLSSAIILLGTELDFTALAGLGYGSLLLVITAIIVTLAITVPVAKTAGIPRRFALMLGIGSAICGSSAIAAAAPVLGADEEETGLSVAVVNLLGTTGIFLLPLVGSVILGLDAVHAGILIGNTLQAVGQVVAAGFSVGDTAGQAATVIKMARILMLSPLLVFLSLTAGRNGTSAETGTRRVKFKIPPFIIGFIIMSLLATFNLLPAPVLTVLGRTGKYLLITAMAGIGLKITFKSILRDGSRALAAGTLIFVLQIVFSAAVIKLAFR